MTFNNSRLEYNTNIMNNNTICSLNENKKTCLPENILYSLPKENIIVSKNSLHIINNISKSCNCDNEKDINKKELCIIKNLNIENKECILYDYFKPEGDYDPNSWLNNTHVDLIQEHLYKKYINYYYSFIHMIDNVMIVPKNIKCLKHEVKSILEIDFIKEINEQNEFNGNGKMKWYGIVYNTDPSHKTGQHWFTILFNFSTSGTETDPYLVEYFNSSGLDIQDIDFKKFLFNLIFRINFETNKKILYKKVTDIQHQSITTGNCGIYSLYYIWSRISGTKIEEFNNPKSIITDNMMEKFRKIMFREN